MAGFLARRTGTMLLVLFVTSILVFLGIRAVPGSPVTVLAGQVQARGGGVLDPSARSGSGTSTCSTSRSPCSTRTGSGSSCTATSGATRTSSQSGGRSSPGSRSRSRSRSLAVLVGAVVGIPLGLLAAVRRGKPTDHVTTGATVVAMSVPNLWLAFLLITWFAVDLHWLPAGGYRSIQSSAREPRPYGAARDRRRVRDRSGRRAADADLDDRLARLRVRPHRPREGARRVGRRRPSRAPQQPDHGRHRPRALVRGRSSRRSPSSRRSSGSRDSDS